MNFLESLTMQINDVIFMYILCGLIIISAFYFTFKSRFAQVRLFGTAVKTLKEKPRYKKVSSFQALMLCTASKVGTANISGVALAVIIGGAGSIFWMWATAFISMSLAMAEATLAQIYKRKGADGNFFGGPAYYIQKAFKKRWLSCTFAGLFIFCFLFGFNALQAHNMVSSYLTYFPKGQEMFWQWGIGITFAAIVAAVVFGGIRRISFVSSYLVPIMASIYLLVGLFVMIVNYDKIPAMFADIFRTAFDFKAIMGGFTGSVVLYGIKRGLLSNEAGMGSAPNAAATADTSHPAKQGIAQVLSVFLDTVLICTTSAFIVLLSGQDFTSLGNNGVGIMQRAIQSQIGPIGIYFITFSITAFAFSAIFGNFGISESNIRFIKDSPKLLRTIQVLSVISIIFGCVAKPSLVWGVSEVLMALIAIVNLITILWLSGKYFRTLKDYENQKKLGEDPVFIAEKCEINDAELWKDKY